MNFSATLNRYLARSYVSNMLLMVLILFGIIYLFDTVELLRRAGKRDDVPLSLVLQMGLLKLPEVGQMLLPFAILFSAMFTFWQLTRRHELTVVRAAGFSVWQFLAPVVGVALAIGALNVTMVNPVGAMLLGRFETLENEFLAARKSYVTLLKEGLWLRQTEEGGSYVILHAGTINLPAGQLHDVMALFFDAENRFTRRIDSETARLEETPGVWLFEQAVSNRPGQRLPEKLSVVALATDLTAKELEESFSSPETLSFWELPGFIRTMESTGFDATRLKIHFQTLLAQPFLFAAMILLAAAVSLRPPRLSGTMALVAGGVIAGFIVFFLSSFLQALGATHQIPVFLAAWSPALVTLLLGGAVMLALEDG